MNKVLAFSYEQTQMCCKECGICYTVPSSWIEQRKADHRTWYCPNGHNWHYPGESDLEKARRLLREAEREAERQQFFREHAERSAASYKGHFNRVKTRVGKGVCPCCNRTFKNLADHMATKHPEYAP